MQVLTNGKDSCLKVVDIRTCTALQTLVHDGFRTGFQYSGASFSPDGKIVIWKSISVCLLSIYFYVLLTVFLHRICRNLCGIWVRHVRRYLCVASCGWTI
jgi:hypothetical protein